MGLILSAFSVGFPLKFSKKLQNVFPTRNVNTHGVEMVVEVTIRNVG